MSCRAIEVRHKHPYGFRSGTWARFVQTLDDPETGRELMLVEFPDGVIDLWVGDDPDEPYEFRSVAREAT